MKILCMGDSLTYGYGVIPCKTWIYHLSLALPEITFINEGLNGDTLQGMLHRLHSKPDLTQYNYTFIMGGTNDILGGDTADNCYQKLKNIIQYIENNNSVPIIGIPMEVFWAISNENAVLGAYRTKILDLSNKNNYHIIDFYQDFKTAILCNLNVYDGDVHPNESGYFIMSETAKNVFSTLL